MELLYVWIQQYNNITNQEFNFSKDYICELDKEKNININIKQDAVSNDFFKLNANAYRQTIGEIVNITGIIGANGTGKSSILDFIIEKVNCLISGKFEKNEEMIAIVRKENMLYIYTNSTIINQIIIEDINLEYEVIDGNIAEKTSDYNIIYYSNIFDGKNNFLINDNIIDISTNHLLKKDKNYRLSEIQRQLDLIASDIKIKLPFKYPEYLKCSFSPIFYLSEIVNPENGYDFENIVFHVFSNYFKEGIWKKEVINSRAPFDIYNSELCMAITCIYKEYNSNGDISKKYTELLNKAKNDIRKNKDKTASRYYPPYEEEERINRELDNLRKYCIATNLPYDSEQEIRIIQKVEEEFNHRVRVEIYFGDKIFELIESSQDIREAYFKYKNINEKTKVNMLEYIPANKSLQEFRHQGMEELSIERPYEQLKIRICLSYFFVFYRTSQNKKNFRVNSEQTFKYEFLEKNIGTVDKVLHFFENYKDGDLYKKSTLAIFLECLDKLVKDGDVIIDEKGEGFKLRINKEHILSYKQLITTAYNNTQEIFKHNFDFLDFDWYDMSSGEKARLNLISRFHSTEKSICNERYLLILIDEGETYFHPEWQREYVYLLLETLPIIFNENKIQIIFTSNSPIVISDLPRENIVFLENIEGLCSVRKNNTFRDTFGANVHTLLSDSFFMKNDIIGEFAREKITKIIYILNKSDEEFKDWVKNNRVDLKNIKKEISIIGEDLIRNKLTEMYISKVDKLNINKSIFKNRKNEHINLKHMTDDELQKFKDEIENVLRERDLSDKDSN